jgi:CRP/FNR family cyclic AMP-dependent transcriptional regulator
MTHVALVTTLLGRTDLFRSLSEADCRTVAARMRKATYESGQLIFSRGDPGEEMYLVVEGRVRLSVLSVEGKVLSFGHASRGDIFGEIAALDGQARSADATALTRVTTMMLARASFRSLMEARPQLAHAAVAFVCQRLRACSDHIEDIALHSTHVRLARFLLAAIAMKGESEADLEPVDLDLAMSQTELGLLLGASRSKVNEALATLEKLGAVRRSEGRVACCVRALQVIAQLDSSRTAAASSYGGCRGIGRSPSKASAQ